MRLSYPRVLYLLTLLACAWLTMHPSPAVERVLAYPLAPLRLLGELATPLRALGRSESVRAQGELVALLRRESEDSQLLIQRERAAALPSDPKLRRGRTFLHAQVVRRSARVPDRLFAALDGGETQGVEPGLPVVRGDVYVGRVVSVHPAEGEVAVALVTGAESYVGAALPDDVRLVVGGVVALEGGPADRFGLEVHNPSRREALSGLARVHEPALLGEPFAGVAEGFELGEIEPAGDGWALRPRVDYKDGLFELAVVVPVERELEPRVEPSHVLFDSVWVPARALGPGSPTRGREGLRVSAGYEDGVRVGAAAVVGPRVVGRVVGARAFDAELALLGDPGLSLPVLASVAGRAEPLVLGRLVALGRDDDGALRFAWRRRGDAGGPERAEGSEPLPATLFTGSGDPGLPRGLVIGRTELPVGPGPHVLRVADEADLRRLGNVHLRRAAPRTGGAP